MPQNWLLSRLPVWWEGSNQLQKNNESGSVQPSNSKEKMAGDFQNDEGFSFSGVISPYRILALCPAAKQRGYHCSLNTGPLSFLLNRYWDLNTKHQYEPELLYICVFHETDHPSPYEFAVMCTPDNIWCVVKRSKITGGWDGELFFSIADIWI